MDQKILDRILRSPKLPSLPAIALEVIDLVQQKDVKIDHIAQTIQHDAALSSKILKTVNSSYYGQTSTVSTISQALVILGLNTVKTLALGFSLVSNLNYSDDGSNFDHLCFWKRSLYSAVAARTLAREVQLIEHEEAFLGGLMQDVGILVLIHTLGEEYMQLLVQVGHEHRLLIALERDHFGTDHAEIGFALAQKWNLPPQLTQPIRYHEEPLAVDQTYGSLVKCVALGGHAADVFISDQPGATLHRYFDRADQWLNLPEDRANPLLKLIHGDTVQMRRLFDLPTGDLGDPDAILARASEALHHVSLQAAQQTEQLQQQNRALQLKATTDSLTGIANRGNFNEYIVWQFGRADDKTPLSVLFIDTDHFKRFNDTYGHQLGDKVLVELAGTLKTSVPEDSLAARYGGEEFAVVLPHTDRVTAARIAEDVRKDVEAITVESEEGEKLHITASIGVATYEGDLFVRVEQLVKAADQAVYAAKNSGRNCVRIFVPQRKQQVA